MPALFSDVNRCNVVEISEEFRKFPDIPRRRLPQSRGRGDQYRAEVLDIMKKWSAFAVLGVLVFVDTAMASEKAPLIALGVARVDITPEMPIRLNGYLVRSAESEGVEQKIWAKALAIGEDDPEKGPGPAILVAVDNLGVPESITDEVAARLHRRVGLAPDRLTIGSSHTHTGPCLTGVAPNIFGKPIPPDQQVRIDAYTRMLVDKLEQVCLDALADRKPGRLGWSQGRVEFAANRRTKGGPVDHSLPVLKATAPDGRVRAIVVNYACHCTTIKPDLNRVDGDWAGYAQAAIEADHPGCVALTLIGCGADANPKQQFQAGAARMHGRALADEVNRLLEGAWTELPGAPEVVRERFTLPYDSLPSREELQRLVQQGGPPGYNALTQLARLDRGEALPTELPYSAQAWRFGDRLMMVFLPGEVVVDYVLRLKEEFDAQRLWVTAYANDVPCYIPSERILREGGYEGGGAMVFYGRPTRLKPGVEQIIIDAVHRVSGEGFLPSKSNKEARADEAMPRPLEPEEGLRAWRTKGGLKVELVASEPLIESPVAVDFGTDGKLWVCEMRDYPSGIDGRYKPGGVIKVLEDRDEDGRYETGTVFLDNLPFPTGVMCWRKGVLICAAPEILYAEDTDGDGKADVRRTLFRGFATENYQARVNGLSYGLDDWVYGANGLIGGKIQGSANGQAVDIGGRDFRFKPDTGVFEPASGLSQQGRVHDDWGNQFGGNNSILIQHYPLADHYARRNPHVAAPAPAVRLARDPELSRLFPASRTLARYNNPESADHVTSACSPLIYRDTVLGPGYVGNAFVCEPVHNLVRRMIVTPEGVTFAGQRAEDERESEFLASTDSWCRPVQVRTGPDGALWVVDMYRFVIEHPRWISPERLATLDVRAGSERGRIYRIVPADRALRPVPKLGGEPTRELAAALDSPNGTLRDHVQRVLIQRGDRTAAPVLVELVRTSTLPECRAQALATLEGLGSLEPSTVVQGLGDAHAGVRREAVRLSERWLGQDRGLEEVVVALADDPDISVRFQVALSLGAWAEPEAGRALGRIAIRDGADHWVRAAVLSSAVPHVETLLSRVIVKASAESGRGSVDSSAEMIAGLIATAAGSGDREKIARVLVEVGVKAGSKLEPWRIGAVADLLDVARDPSLGDEAAVRSSIDAARTLLKDGGARPKDRVVAARLVGRLREELADDRAALAACLDPSEPVEVQLAAIRGLAKMADRDSAAVLLDHWARLSPSNRVAALDALLVRDETAEVLITALEGGRIAAAQFDAARRERLVKRESEALRRRAEGVFEHFAVASRQQVVNAYASARTLPGDAGRGRQVFERTCASCHKLAGIGHEVGPDLAALTDTSTESLLIAILDPNREVDARYASYTAGLKDGRVLTGLIVDETASAVTLKRQDGQADSLLRNDLEELTTAGRSLMPEGLENDIKPSELADLMAFLVQRRAPSKEIAGNQPRTIEAGEDGSITLAASSAEIYGPSLTFELEQANLGYWHSEDDRAAWTFQVNEPTTFTASLEWACEKSSAGNTYEIRVDDRVIRHARIGGTGGWASYRTLFLLELRLSAGVHRLEMRPVGAIHGALADVRRIVLTPREPEGASR